MLPQLIPPLHLPVPALWPGSFCVFPEEVYCVPICPLISLLKSRWDPSDAVYDWSYFDGVQVMASFVAVCRPQQSEQDSTCNAVKPL